MINIMERICFDGDFVTEDDFINNYDRTYFLLDILNDIVGYYMWYPEEDYAYLYSFAIDKYYQGNGYSKTMLEYFLANSGYNRHCLHVRPDNNKAIQLYKNYGFIQTDTVDNFYEDGTSAIIMLKNEI